MIERKVRIDAETEAARLAELRTCNLVDRPEEAASLSACELESALRLAIICNNPRELELVAYVLYHRLSHNEAGRRLNITGAQVSEVLDSLKARVRVAEQRLKTEQGVAKMALAR